MDKEYVYKFKKRYRFMLWRLDCECQVVVAMLKPKPPCVPECLRRSITCHAECREYMDYAGRLKKYNNAVKAEKHKGADARDLRSEQVPKWNRRYGR